MDDTQTIHVERIGRTPTTAIEVVHSPDDGGYYLGNTDFQRGRQRVSIDIWPSKAAAVEAWHRGEVNWEGWRGG
jgi:hypothetical protein